MEQIRLATESDMGGMSDLLSVLFDQEAEFSADRRAQIDGLTAILDSPQVGRLVVCEVDRVLVGMVGVLYTISTALGARVAILEDMIVLPSFRGRGIGRKLIERMIDQCARDGCRRITLLTDDDNVSAHRFYERVGFGRSMMVTFRMPIAADRF